MIEPKFYKTRKDGVNLYITKSENGFKILQVETGIVYNEAIDVEGANYTYEETTERIDKEENKLI